jgi:hypothetical protein
VFEAAAVEWPAYVRKSQGLSRWMSFMGPPTEKQ